MHAALESLAKQEWLASVGGDSYAFRQSTSRDAAYAMLVDDDKRLAHGRAAEWLAEHAESDAAAIAQHFERASDTARSGPWWTLAAEQAAQGGM